MLKKLYEKNEIWFSLLWIAIYAVGYAAAESLSSQLGITMVVNLIFLLILSIVLFSFMKKNKLLEKYGLCISKIPARYFLYYIPLIILSTHNFWYGVAKNFSFLDAVCYIGSMLLVGFVEEVLFRGLLYKAMSKDSIKAAIIVSSLTFGLAHFAHLFDGSGITLVANFCQVFGAIAVGFLFVSVFYRSGSLIACILTHSFYDAFSAFANEAAVTDRSRIMINVIQFAVLIVYAVFILQGAKKDPQRNGVNTSTIRA